MDTTVITRCRRCAADCPDPMHPICIACETAFTAAVRTVQRDLPELHAIALRQTRRGGDGGPHAPRWEGGSPISIGAWDLETAAHHLLEDTARVASDAPVGILSTRARFAAILTHPDRVVLADSEATGWGPDWIDLWAHLARRVGRVTHPPEPEPPTDLSPIASMVVRPGEAAALLTAAGRIVKPDRIRQWVCRGQLDSDDAGRVKIGDIVKILDNGLRKRKDSVKL